MFHLSISRLVRSKSARVSGREGLVQSPIMF